MRVQIADLFTFNAQGKIATMKAYWDERCLSMARLINELKTPFGVARLSIYRFWLDAARSPCGDRRVSRPCRLSAIGSSVHIVLVSASNPWLRAPRKPSGQTYRYVAMRCPHVFCLLLVHRLVRALNLPPSASPSSLHEARPRTGTFGLPAGASQAVGAHPTTSWPDPSRPR